MNYKKKFKFVVSTEFRVKGQEVGEILSKCLI